MKPLHHKTYTLAKRGLSLLCVLALCLGLLPTAALAAGEDAPGTLWVGQTQITASGYWKTNDDGTLTTEGAGNDNYNVYYDGNGTLTLKNANIQGRGQISQGDPQDDGIYAAPTDGQSVSLTIKLIGSNTVGGLNGICVEAQNGGNATLVIQSDGNDSKDSLEANGSGWNGIKVSANSGNASLTLNNASVKAITESNSYYGVCIIGLYANNPILSLTVNGGSLTAQGGYGIRYVSVTESNPSTSLMVSDGALIKAIPNISASGASKPTPQAESGSGGIVFEGNSGTVYGDVTLDESLIIGEGEILTIPERSTLNTNGNLTNNGTINVESGGKLEGETTGTVVHAPTITAQPADKTVTEGQTASFTVTVTGDSLSYQWQQSTNGSDWTNVSSSTSSNTYTIDNITTSMSGTQYRCVVSNSAGSVESSAATLTVNAATVSVTSVTLNKTELALFTGESETLTAKVAPANATNQAVTWSSDNTNVATVESGIVTAKSAGTAIITATAADGSGKSATCTVTVTDKTYTISADTTALNFGSVYTGYAQPAAQTVTLTNTGNQPVILNQPVSTDNFEVGALSTTSLPVNGTATFTVQPKTGLSAGTYNETIEVTGTEGAAVTIPASFTVKSRPSYNPPTVSEETIDAIKAADPGETVTVDLSSGDTTLDKEVFETLAGKDVTLVIDLGDDVSWTVNGSDVPEDADFTDIDMGVTMNSDGIPVDIINAITGERGSIQLELAHNGAFGFTMTLTAPLGEENAGYWANLYHFDEEANAMTFETAAPIGSDGSVSLAFSHASQYVLVIDDHNHGIVELPFTDVADSDWFYDPVCFVYSQGLMTGTSATTFEPNISLSRAMLVAVLHRLEGSPQASGGDFTDVAEGDWYAQAVNWAASVGVVNGFDDGTFQPNVAITREQMAAILRNYAAYKGLDVSASGSLSTFTDAASVSDWAKESVEWAVGSGLIGGYEDSTLRPQGTTTRAEVASVLQRALGNVAGNQ